MIAEGFRFPARLSRDSPPDRKPIGARGLVSFPSLSSVEEVFSSCVRKTRLLYVHLWHALGKPCTRTSGAFISLSCREVRLIGGCCGERSPDCSQSQYICSHFSSERVVSDKRENTFACGWRGSPIPNSLELASGQWLPYIRVILLHCEITRSITPRCWYTTQQ